MEGVHAHARLRGSSTTTTPTSPIVGQAFLDRARRTGVDIVSVHKGLAGGNPHASPVDIGPAAVANPDLRFVVYHSGYEARSAEGPYDPDGAGVDRLARSLEDSGVAPGANVYAELGSTWFNAMRDPDVAAHTLGKLLVAVGPDNVVWGTDSIWYGSPQTQIEAFRAFEITPEYQERFGYPALTPALKRKILGGNGAALYGVDPFGHALRVHAGGVAAGESAAPGAPGVVRAEHACPPCSRTSASTAGSASSCIRPGRW